MQLTWRTILPDARFRDKLSAPQVVNRPPMSASGESGGYRRLRARWTLRRATLGDATSVDSISLVA